MIPNATTAIAARKRTCEDLVFTLFLMALFSLNFAASLPVSNGSLVHFYRPLTQGCYSHGSLRRPFGHGSVSDAALRSLTIRSAIRQERPRDYFSARELRL
jgi:hypothetical protein